jgi:transcriptional activator SPT8
MVPESVDSPRHASPPSAASMADVDPLSEPDLDSGDSPLSAAPSPAAESTSPEPEQPSSEPDDVDADAGADDQDMDVDEGSTHHDSQQQQIEHERPAEHESSYPSLVARRLASVKATTPRLAPKGYSVAVLTTLPHSTPVNALALPPCSSHVLTGGQDGFIRRFGLHTSLATTLGLGQEPALSSSLFRTVHSEMPTLSWVT